MKRMKMLVLAAALVLSGSLYAKGPCEGSKKDGCCPAGEVKKGGCDKKKKNHKKHHSKMMGGMHRMMAGLNLTTEQKDKLKKIREAHKEQLKSLMQKMRESRKAMMKVMTSDNVDEAAIRKQATAAAQAQADMMIAGRKMMEECKAILTPEQKEKLNSKVKEMKERMEKRRKHFKCGEKGEKGRKGKCEKDDDDSNDDD